MFDRVREKARQATCLSNLGQTSKGVRMYIDDYDEMFPFVLNGSANWTQASLTGDDGRLLVRTRFVALKEGELFLYVLLAPHLNGLTKKELETITGGA